MWVFVLEQKSSPSFRVHKSLQDPINYRLGFSLFYRMFGDVALLQGRLRKNFLAPIEKYLKVEYILINVLYFRIVETVEFF